MLQLIHITVSVSIFISRLLMQIEELGGNPYLTKLITELSKLYKEQQ